MKCNLHIPNEKAKIAFEYVVHPNMLSRWESEVIAGLAFVFKNNAVKNAREKGT